MKKKGALIVLLLFSIIFIPQVYSTTVVTCDEYGRIEIQQMTPDITGVVYANKLNDASFQVPGEWSSDKSVNMNTFVSDEGLFTDRAFYDVEIRVGGGRYVARTLCPGFQFSCRYFNPEIQECIKKGDNKYFLTFKTDVSNPNNLRYEFTDVKNRTYSYSPESRHYFVEDLDIAKISDKTYLLAMQSNLDIVEAAISHDSCHDEFSKYYVKDTQTCFDFCQIDGECAYNEFCQNNKCKPLECAPCNEIQEHKCVFLCQDDNPCTEDICEEGELCSNNLNEGCPLNDACMPIGTASNVSSVDAYCDGASWKPKKPDYEVCNVNYECIYDCVEGVCIDPIKLQPPPPKTIEEILGIPGMILIGLFIYAVLMYIFWYRKWKKKHPRKKTYLQKLADHLDAKILEDNIELTLKKAKKYLKNGHTFNAKKTYESVHKYYNRLPNDKKKKHHKKLADMEKDIESAIKK